MLTVYKKSTRQVRSQRASWSTYRKAGVTEKRREAKSPATGAEVQEQGLTQKGRRGDKGEQSSTSATVQVRRQRDKVAEASMEAVKAGQQRSDLTQGATPLPQKSGRRQSWFAQEGRTHWKKQSSGQGGWWGSSCFLSNQFSILQPGWFFLKFNLTKYLLCMLNHWVWDAQGIKDDTKMSNPSLNNGCMSVTGTRKAGKGCSLGRRH